MLTENTKNDEVRKKKKAFSSSKTYKNVTLQNKYQQQSEKLVVLTCERTSQIGIKAVEGVLTKILHFVP